MLFLLHIIHTYLSHPVAFLTQWTYISGWPSFKLNKGPFRHIMTLSMHLPGSLTCCHNGHSWVYGLPGVTWYYKACKSGQVRQLFSRAWTVNTSGDRAKPAIFARRQQLWPRQACVGPAAFSLSGLDSSCEIIGYFAAQSGVQDGSCEERRISFGW